MCMPLFEYLARFYSCISSFITTFAEYATGVPGTEDGGDAADIFGHRAHKVGYGKVGKAMRQGMLQKIYC